MSNVVSEICVNVPIDRTFFYSVPDYIVNKLKIGVRVKVDFRKKTKIGYCVGIYNDLKFDMQLKEIISIIDETPLVTQEDIEIAKWISKYYLCSLSKAIDCIVPAPVRRSLKRRSRVDPFRDFPVKKTPPHTPTEEQRKCLLEIEKSITEGQKKIFLLFGITGSGKTEVYLRAIERVIKEKKQAIVLVPEVSLTPQTVRRFRERFDDNQIAILHSYLSDAERKNEWQRIKENKAKIVIGARSAVFAPTQNLGLIVIDEEHENTFKQENTPRYNARDVAIKKAQIYGATVVLASATPSLESYHKTLTGEYHLLTLTKRIDNLPLPTIKVIDMRQETYKKTENVVISNPLKNAVVEALANKKQVILFLNRRGFSTFCICQHCGEVLKCERCDSLLILHKSELSEKKDVLMCHLCLKEYEKSESCPKCSHSQIKYLGIGTQKVESCVREIFSEAKTTRLDSDAVKTRSKFKQIFSDLHSGNIGILIGTQMVAKGLDFSDIAVVGVVSADTMLNISDFRASERTFQLLTQVAGRAGRSHISSRVYIQTYIPESISIQLATRQDFISFANLELENRRKLNYPPFFHLLRILLSGKDLEKVSQRANKIVETLSSENEQRRFDVLGPAPCPNPKIKNKHRWHIIIKVVHQEDVPKIITSCEKYLKSSHSVKIILDFDPVSLM